MGGGGSKIGKYLKQKAQNQLCWLTTHRVDNNKTKPKPVPTASHHSSLQSPAVWPEIVEARPGGHHASYSPLLVGGGLFHSPVAGDAGCRLVGHENARFCVNYGHFGVNYAQLREDP